MLINKNGEFSGLILGEIDLEKSEKSKTPYSASFTGVASTQKLDIEKQIVIQKGLNFAPFIDYGHFNDGHPVFQRDDDGKVISTISTGQMVAIPVGKKAWLCKSTNQWNVHGQFLPHVKQANNLVDLAKSFAEIKTDRRLGLSVEGKLQEVSADEAIVKKADIYRVTVTPQPVNTDCQLDLLAKAITDEMHYQEKVSGTLINLAEKDKIKTIMNLAKSRNINIEDAIDLFYKYAHKIKV